MECEIVRSALGGLQFMTPEQGRVIYDHILRYRPQSILELGTAHGASAAYIAAALEANGSGHLTSVDIRRWANPTPQETLERIGLTHRVNFVQVHASSYNWFLKSQIEAQSDDQGNCQPLYDFCYIDGPHEWNVDGLATLLVEKLLLPDGWVLFDDFNWIATSDEPVLHPRSAAELAEPHVRKIFELLVMQHPSFSSFRIQDDSWGWAQKRPAERRRLRVDTHYTLGGFVLHTLRRLRGSDV